MQPTHRRTLTVASLNLGLLRLKVIGITVFQFAPFVDYRLKAAPRVLAELDVDILVLQEMFGVDQRRQLAADLANLYPYSASSDSSPLVGLGDGFLILSRYPIDEHRIFHFRRRFLEESVIGGIGFQVAHVSVPELGTLPVFNVHLTAGGVMHNPQSRRTEHLRASQITQLLKVTREGEPCHLLAGDFNAGPDISSANYRQVIDAGYIDCFVEDARLPKFTWETTNPLNTNGPHKHCPSQRMDHIFVPTVTTDTLMFKRADIVLNIPNVEVQKGQTCTISDHYAVRVEFEIFC